MFSQTLKDLGLSEKVLKVICHLYDELKNKDSSSETIWQKISKVLLELKENQKLPFDVHLFLYKAIYPEWNKLPCPAWFPDPSFVLTTNLAKLMDLKKCRDYVELHDWSKNNRSQYWGTMVDILGVQFDVPYKKILDLSDGVENPNWFPGAKLNIANSCFLAQKLGIAIIQQNESGERLSISYQELDKISNQVANALTTELNLKKEDCIAIIMPMTWESVAIYLGILKAGMVCVSIAESFSADEIELRLKITKTKAIFTQDAIIRDHKTLKLYDKIINIENAPVTILISGNSTRNCDVSWKEFIQDQSTAFEAVSCLPSDPINILFSSGTTGDPKAIPWTQTTPIKCASDAFCHHNLQNNDIICWYSSLGWMMGPWLVFAALLNKATIALYTGTPNDKEFGSFIEKNKISILGVVPTLVKHWRETQCMEELDWTNIKVITSTGECSNVEDMLYLMWLCGYRPIIEYCGGTEIGGAYITATVIQPSAPAMFTTPAMGLDFVILDKHNNQGEVALIPPSIGLSTSLVNAGKDHHEIYYADMPETLRRHGDEIVHYQNGYYRMLGRADDTMNLSGIKVSSAEIERVLHEHPSVYESAAIAVPPREGGPLRLVIYVVLKTETDPIQLKLELQTLIKKKLNPLFKISDVCIVPTLTRTASNKVMRRVLRREYQNKD